MTRLAAFVLALCLANAAGAQSPGAAAEAAARQLAAASQSLDQARSARDRVRALTETVRAFEAGLAAMRDGLRAAAVRQLQLEQGLAARENEIARLLTALQTISRAPPPVLMAHPDGPIGAARSGMLLAEVTPALNAEADSLRGDLDEVRTLRRLQEQAEAQLQDGLLGVQAARLALSNAIADRTDLPRRFTEDPIKTAILIASTETLDAFASGLSQIGEGEIPPPANRAVPEKGRLPLPVQGQILRRAGEADAAGVTRPGLVIATRPQALVTTPVAATIRYTGPLLDYGTVAILEPQADTLFVLAGLSQVFGATGEVIPAGSPVGLMGGTMPQAGAILSQTSDGGGTERPETLYMEVREGNRPVDPLTWFETDKDG